MFDILNPQLHYDHSNGHATFKILKRTDAYIMQTLEDKSRVCLRDADLSVNLTLTCFI